MKKLLYIIIALIILGIANPAYADFTPPAAEGSPDGFDVLYVHFNEADGSTTPDDASDSNHTINNNATVATDDAQGMFSTNSSLHDGDSDFWDINDSADFDYGADPFTIHFWIRFNVLPSAGNNAIMYSQYLNSTNQLHWYIIKDTNFYFYMYLNGATGGTGVIEITNSGDQFPLSADTWYHVAWERTGNDHTMYLAGVTEATKTDTDDMPDIASSVTIGAASPAGGEYVNGWIDEFVVSKGIARFAVTEVGQFINIKTTWKQRIWLEGKIRNFYWKNIRGKWYEGLFNKMYVGLIARL